MDDHERVRLVLVAVAVAALLAVHASAADVDPKALVLRQADVPSGFRLDLQASGVRTNASESRRSSELRALLTRSGRVTGYEAEFDGRDAMIRSRTDLFRRPEGARMMLIWVDKQARLSGLKGLKRARAGVGAESWIYWQASASGSAVAIWRYGAAFAGVQGLGLSKARVLALARKQQRRIAAALR